MENKAETQMAQTSYEKLVYDIWSKILNHQSFGIDDGFFDVGGTSLGALEVISQLNQSFELDIDDFFASPTIRDIAGSLQENPEAMKKHFREVLAFSPLKTVDQKAMETYQMTYKEMGPVQNNNDQYKDILLLGATGFLGVYLLHEILLQSTAKVTLLIRPKPNAESALEKKYDYYFGSGSFDKYKDRIQIVQGDLVKDQMGLEKESYERLANRIDAVINSAALVKHMGKNAEFTSVNVDTVGNIITFAKSGCKKDIHHMSTIGVAYGDQRQSQDTLFTEYTEQINYPLNNQYLSSKYQAEQLIIGARESDTNTTLYRMNGILFDSKTGKYQENMEQSTAYIFYRALYKLGLIPKEIQRPMDISNVDMVSKAVISLMLSNQNKNQIHHVFNPKPLMIQDILEKMRGNRLGKTFEALSVDDIYEAYQKADDTQKRYYQEIAFQCEIMGSIGKNELNVCVEKTNYILEHLGFKWNDIETETLGKACDEAILKGFDKA